MATVRPKTTVVQHLTATCPTHSRSDVAVRDLESVIDEPVERDGTNLGLTPTETLLAALIGCTNVISHKIAHQLGVEMRDMSIDADAVFDRRGTTLQEEIEVPFEKIDLHIRFSTPNSPEEVSKVREELKKFCPLSKVIRNAGTPIEEHWNVTHV